MFYSIYIPENNEVPYLKMHKSEYTLTIIRGIDIPSSDIGILYPSLKLHVLIKGNLADIFNYNQCEAEIYAIDDFYEDKFQCLSLDDAQKILNLLLKRKYYLWDKDSIE